MRTCTDRQAICGHPRQERAESQPSQAPPRRHFPRGQTTNPVPKAVEFAAETVASAFIERNPGAVRIKRAHNTFVATADSRRWTALPRIEADAAAKALPVGVALAAFAAGGLAALGYTRLQSPRRGRTGEVGARTPRPGNVDSTISA